MEKEKSNPWENNPELFAEILRKKHNCPTYWDYDDEFKLPNGDIGYGAKLNEYWVNEECANGCCEYCYGHRYNEWFAEKPTREDIKEFILKQRLKCDMAEKVKRKTYKDLLNNGEGEENDGQLITLCIDKEYKQVPKLATEIISVIRNTKYNFIENGYACIEVFGKDDFAPHIHIVTKKLKRNGVIAQTLRRKFQTTKWQVYRVDVKALPYNTAWDYVGGEKQLAKQGQCEKDREYREKNNLLDLYEL
jgi:hypothetical protein